MADFQSDTVLYEAESLQNEVDLLCSNLVQKGKLIKQDISRNESQTFPDRYYIQKLNSKWNLLCPEFLHCIKLNETFMYKRVCIYYWRVLKENPCMAFISFKTDNGWPISRNIHISEVEGFESLSYFAPKKNNNMV